ncbi:hypothetical protein FRC18_001004 [Serendipita sp. 400]|nr:hypothetical protein FRC18_001004 [Serendipita sp. 400]
MQSTSRGTGLDTHHRQSSTSTTTTEPHGCGCGRITCSCDKSDTIPLPTLNPSFSHSLYSSGKEEKKNVEGPMPAMPRPSSAAVAATAVAVPHNESIHRPQYQRRKTYNRNGDSPPSSNPLLSLVHLDQPVQVPIPPSLERRLSANNTVENDHITAHRYKTTGSRLTRAPSPWYDYDEFGTAKGNIVGGLGIYSRQTMEKGEYVARYANDQCSRLPLHDHHQPKSHIPCRSIAPMHTEHPSPSRHSVSPVSSLSKFHPYTYRTTSPPLYDYPPTRDI